MVSDDEVAELIDGFERCVLPASRWTHEAHLIAACWYLERMSAPDALDELRRRIRAFNESVGGVNSETAGYHETITRLYVGEIHHAMQSLPKLTAAQRRDHVLTSPLAESSWPMHHYSRERLFSVDARRAWMAPDLAPLLWTPLP